MMTTESLASSSNEDSERMVEDANGPVSTREAVNVREESTGNQQLVVPKVKVRPTPEHLDAIRHDFIMRERRFSD